MKTVGILGGGQLGWMTILEGRKLGYRFLVLDESPDAPASRVADRWFPPEQVEDFCREADVITYEFEHIDEEVLSQLVGEVRPSLEVLELKRSRIREKTFLSRRGYPVCRFREADRETLEEALEEIGYPAVVKSESLGYDGKGQYRIASPADLEDLKGAAGERFLVEEFVPFTSEISAVGVRSRSGEIKVYPVTENVHEGGILLYNYVSSRREVERAVVSIVSELMEELSLVGLLAVEFFLTEEEDLLINEFAPRPHNTGHYTLDGTYTSQFENLLRVVTDLPPGSTKLKLSAGMVNILGLSLEDIDLREVLSVEGARLYWYGKKKRPRRKMGHVNVVATDRGELTGKMGRILDLLYRREFTLR